MVGQYVLYGTLSIVSTVEYIILHIVLFSLNRSSRLFFIISDQMRPVSKQRVFAEVGTLDEAGWRGWG